MASQRIGITILLTLALLSPAFVDSSTGHQTALNALNEGLQQAIVGKLPKEVESALDAGADPNFVNKDNASPLMFAAYYGHADILEQLIGAGADLRIEHKNGFEAFDFALETPHIPVMLRLIRELGKTATDPQIHPLVEFALGLRDNPTTVIDPSERNFQSLALMATVVSNDKNRARALLDLGVSPNDHNVTGYAALPMAARLNRQSMISLLLAYDADINLGNNGDDEASAMNQAARSGNAQLLTWLLQRGADVNKANARGYAPLHLAVYRQCSSCVEVLLRSGAHIDLATNEDETALSIAEKLDHQEIRRQLEAHRVQLAKIDALVNLVRDKKLTHEAFAQIPNNLLQVYPSDGRPLLSHIILNQPELTDSMSFSALNLDQAESTGLHATPLMYAVSQNNIKLVNQLISHGAEINHPDLLGNPAIDWASYYGFEEVVALLLAADAEIAITSPHGDALDITMRRGHHSAARLISNHLGLTFSSAEAEARFRQIDNKDFAEIERITIVKSDLDKDALGNSLLHHAALQNCLVCAEQLLRKKHPVDDRNRIGMTPLMISVQNGFLPLTRLLIQHGSDIDAQTYERGMQVTSLMLAAIHNQEDALELLISLNAELDVRDSSGNTAAIWALSEGHEKIAARLVRAGSDEDIKNHYGYSVNILRDSQKPK